MVLIKYSLSRQYKKRFLSITNNIDIHSDKKIIELCFGDTYIANWCYHNNIEWLV